MAYGSGSWCAARDTETFMTINGRPRELNNCSPARRFDTPPGTDLAIGLLNPTIPNKT